MAMPIFIYIVVCVLELMARWSIFIKADEKGWKSIIPFYGSYTTFKIFWQTIFFWVGVVTSLVLGISIIISIDYYPESTVFLSILLTMILSLLSIVLKYRMAKSFKHGAGYTLGLIFFPAIFTMILGFSKDKYKKLKK